jgi:Flp pilus assembly protein TadG
MLKGMRCSLIRKIARDERGVTALEFALVAPLIIALYLGCVEISSGVAADRKVRLVASAVANLTAQATTISADDMTNILNASSAIILPYEADKLTVTISCLKIDTNGNATVAWSETRGGTPLAVNSAYTFDANSAVLALPNSSLVIGESQYAYTPAVGYTITGTINLSEKMFMSPRISAPSYDGTACS